MERLSKWESTGRSRVYMGHYHFHSGSVELVLNIITGYVPPSTMWYLTKISPLWITRGKAHYQETGKTGRGTLKACYSKKLHA